jgi:superfamily I DNA/RNA helicase
VLVVAGPGTGKTQTLIGRVAALLDAGKNPRRVLAVTFTRRAAREMEERLVALFGESVSLPRADTLHSLAFEVWKNAWEDAPVLLSEDGARRVFAEANPGADAATLKTAWAALNLARERRMPDDPALAEFGELHHNYVKLKESWNLADYTDLLEFYLEQSQGDHFHPIHHHVLVDEVQDLSPLQLELIAKLTPEGGAGFFAIGDPLQSIYSFRGAAGDVAERLRGYWPKLETITLTENYRSGQTVLDAAQGLFPQAQKLRSQAEEQGRVHLFNAPDGMREAAWISERVKRLIGATSHSLTDAGEAGRLTPGEIAVLVRFKGLVPKIRKALERHGIPVSVPEAEAFWNEPRIAAILGAAGRILGLACQEDDEHCYDFPERVLAGGPGAIRAHLESLGDFDPSFWQSRAYREFRSAFEEHGGWTGLMNWVNLQTDLEHASQAAEKVQVMTLHASKGLEFEAVFLPALEDGILPFAGPGLLSGNLQGAPGMNVEEERRLFFVGMTRARSELYLSYATRRMQYGQNLQLPPCRYLAELPKGLVSRSTLAARKVQKQRQISLLD